MLPDMNTERLPYLDALRVAAFALLVPYHVGMYYVSWDWHVKSPQASPSLDAFMLISSPWRLGLLFFVGGVAAQLLWTKRGTVDLLKDRSKRLLLPLLFGILVIVVPQAYFEVKTKVPLQLPGDGGYFDFWWAYVHGGHYCRGQDCMVVPTWNHLWFLPYLWVYAWLAPLLTKAQDWRPFQLPDWAWCVLPALPLVAARLWVAPHFPTTHDLIHDFYNHLQYAYLFMLGWLCRTPVANGFWAAVQRQRRMLLWVVLLSWLSIASYYHFRAQLEPLPMPSYAQRILWVMMGWWGIGASCGLAKQWVRHDSPALRADSGAVFCLYVLHQSVIVLLTQALAPFWLPWWAEAPLLIALTFGVCVGAYATLRHVPGLRLLVGIAPPSRASSPSSDPKVLAEQCTLHRENSAI